MLKYIMGGKETWAEYLSVFGNRDFRWFFSGRIVSTVGDNLYRVAAMWLVYSLTSSTFFTGFTAFLSRFPGTFGFLTGPVVDNNNPRDILVGTELVQMVVVLAVPVAAVLGVLHVAIILAIIPLLSISNQFSRPAQRVAVPRIVDEKRLVKANSVFSLTYRGTQAAGKSVSGVLIGLVGAVAIYTIDAVTFLCGAFVFSRIRIPTDEDDGSRNQEPGTYRERFREYAADLKEGHSVVRNGPVFHIVTGTAIANFLNGASIAVLPAFASTYTGPTSYGVLYAGVGAGLFVGASLVSFFESYPFGRTSVTAFLLSGALWMGAVVTPSIYPTVVLFTLAWVPIGVYNILSVSVLQIGVADSVLGRVMSISDSVSGLASAVGLLLGGAAGEFRPDAEVMLLAGAGFLVIGLYWAALPSARSLTSPGDIEEGSFGAPSDR